MLAQRGEQLIGYLHRRAAHTDRVVEHELLELVELLAVVVARERDQLGFSDACPARDRRPDVDAVLARRHRRRLQLRQDLQPRRDPADLGGDFLEHPVADQ